MPTLQHTPNFRDLGGMPNAAGHRVRTGQVYRSELLVLVDEQDRAVLDGLNIGAVFDLRNPLEREKAPTAWPQPAGAVRLHLMPQELKVAGADMHQLVRGLRDGTLEVAQVGQTMLTTYRAMPSHFASVLAQLFRTLADAPPRAALIHCTAGKDRTGFVCAMLLQALDVGADQVLQDYLASARLYSLQRLVQQMERLSGRAFNERMTTVLAELAQVKAAYMDVALDEINKTWGSPQAYLREAAGLDAGLAAALKARLLD